jgi:asparagine synthase (glutamine-hydrolysing)
MCGFLGFVGVYDKQLKDKFMLTFDSINHRGPDSSGVCESDNFLLGHKRLSIIDLNSRSNQPFSDGTSWLLYNGEIYNYQDLREELSADYGCSFHTDGDTEVLFYGLNYEGVQFLSKIDGMFAIFFMSIKGEVILARDQFGQKPLFYGFNRHNNLVLGSELLPILDLIGTKDLSINRGAFNKYFQFGASIAPSTFYNEVHQVCAGEAVTICADDGMLKKEFWHHLPTNPVGKNDIKQALSARLKSCFVADTPIAILSSGGIDSSALIKASSSLHVNRSTIAVHLKTSEDEKGSFIAKKMESDQLPLLSVESVIEKGGVKDQAAQFLLNRFGEPFADTSYFYSEQLYSAIPLGYKVVIGGDGADEVFLGYRPALYFYVSSFVTRIVPLTVRNFAITHLSQYGRMGLLMSVLLGCRESSEKVLMGFSSNDLSYLERDNFSSADKINSEILSGRQVIDFYESYLMTRLSNVFLRKSDHASMKFSKELRSPYLQGNPSEFRSMGNILTDLIPKFKLKAYVRGTIGMASAFRQKVGFDMLTEDRKESTRQHIMEWCFENRILVEYFFDFDRFIALVQGANKDSHLFRIQVFLHWVKREYQKET